MSSYIITVKFYDEDLVFLEAKFSLSIKDGYMVDVFESVSDYEDGEDIPEEDRDFNGSIYDDLESLISENPGCFIVC